MYYKVTRKGGVSFQDTSFVYKVGMVVHPNPDRKSQNACGEGIHLAKSFPKAKYFANGYEDAEYYEASPGVILGEDFEKVRCASCLIIKQLTKEDIEALKPPPPKPILEPICGFEWLKTHEKNITQQDIDNLKMEVVTDRQKITVSSKLSKKELRTVLAAI